MAGLVADCLALCAAGVVVAALAAGQLRYQSAFTEQTHLALTLTAAAVGAAAAILGDVATRLSRDRRPSWIAAALALYSLLVVPSSTAWADLVGSAAAARWVRAIAFAAVAALLILAIRPPRRLGGWGGWIIAAATVAACLVVSERAVALPAAFSVEYPALISTVALIAWGAVVTGFVLAGLRRGHGPLRRVGLGLLLVAASHFYRGSLGLDVTAPDLAFDVVRLAGLVMVLVGAVQLVAAGMARIRSERQAYEDDLRAASTHMQRAAQKAAERDHELRNGLVGLSGVTNLLSSSPGDAEQDRLRSAVLRELARLAGMLEDGTPGAPARGYDVGTVLADIVDLRRSAGLDVQLDATPALRAHGSPAVLAQVLTNLLANSAQHAAGSPVRVQAGACGTRIIVEVADDGPGVAPGHESLVVERGVRHPRTGGNGLGLHVSRQLLASEGGLLRVAPATPGQPGCTVVVELARSRPWNEPAVEVDPGSGVPLPRPALDPERWSLPAFGAIPSPREREEPGARP